MSGKLKILTTITVLCFMIEPPSLHKHNADNDTVQYPTTPSSVHNIPHQQPHLPWISRKSTTSSNSCPGGRTYNNKDKKHLNTGCFLNVDNLLD